MHPLPENPRRHPHLACRHDPTRTIPRFLGQFPPRGLLQRFDAVERPGGEFQERLPDGHADHLHQTDLLRRHQWHDDHAARMSHHLPLASAAIRARLRHPHDAEPSCLQQQLALFLRRIQRLHRCGLLQRHCHHAGGCPAHLERPRRVHHLRLHESEPQAAAERGRVADRWKPADDLVTAAHDHVSSNSLQAGIAAPAIGSAIDGDRHKPSVDMPQGVDSRHGFLAEVAALRERDRTLVAGQLLRQRLLRNVDRRGHARFDAGGIPCGRFGPWYGMCLQPRHQTGMVGLVRLHEKSCRTVPVDPHDRHGHIAQQSAAVVKQGLRRPHAQPRRQPCLGLRPRDDQISAVL